MPSVPIQINTVYKQLFGTDGTLRKDVRYFEDYGGRRSAKSHDIVQILGVTAMKEPEHFIPCCRKVGDTLYDSVYSELVGFFESHNIPHYKNKTSKEIILPNKSRFRCFGLNDADRLKSLKGATIIWIEEANECSEDDIDSLDAGLSPSRYPGRIVFTHNPIPQIPGSMHWLQRRFLQIEHHLGEAVINEKANALVLRTWYKNNRWCPKETVKVLEGYKETNPQKYKLWALGEFTTMEGTVFTYNEGPGPGWDIVKAVPPEILPESIGVGLDFGFSNDPSAACRLWVCEREIWVKQLVYKTGLHNDALYAALVAAGVQEYEKVIADSARPDIISDLHRLGIYGIEGVKKKANYKEDVATRLQGYKIHFIEGDTDAIREVSTYAWARDKNGQQLPKLQDGDDHIMDCITERMHEYTGGHSMYDADVLG